MEKYSLNLGENGRIMSVCPCIDGQTYDNVVDSFPDGDVTEYRYENGQFIHDPLPKPDPPEPEPTAEEDTLSMLVDHEERIINLELGLTE
jgi:hypothetical protein